MSKSPITSRLCGPKNRCNDKTLLNKAVSKPSVKQVCENFTQTLDEQQNVVTNLVAELAVAINDKIQLENENAVLKFECNELKQKVNEIISHSVDEGKNIAENVRKLQEEIRQKDKLLAEKDVHVLDEQKKYLQELSRLSNLYYQQVEITDNTRQELTNTIKTLEKKMDAAEIEFNELNNNVTAFQNKSFKYKSKLKYAVDVIKRLSVINGTNYKKPLTVDAQSQTQSDDKFPCDNIWPSSCSMHTQYGLERENIMLSELFFKPKLHGSVESVFFARSSESMDEEDL